MSDLISRQAAIDAIANYLSKTTYTTAISFLNTGALILARVPSAQPEIIRCKDCKHYQLADHKAFGMPVKMCKWFEFEDVDDDDYCSRAERRTDG